uniref:Uncharacterized protein n=1 Tax=candidate division CPR3 bacterium TaxID=2268181 RepID=A0A7C5UVW6_UNCC3
MEEKNNYKKVKPQIFAIIIVILLVLGLGALLFYKNYKPKKTVEEKPKETTEQTNNQTNQEDEKCKALKNEAANWDSYTDEEWKLTFKYPKGGSVEKRKSEDDISYDVTYKAHDEHGEFTTILFSVVIAKNPPDLQKGEEADIRYVVDQCTQENQEQDYELCGIKFKKLTSVYSEDNICSGVGRRIVGFFKPLKEKDWYLILVAYESLAEPGRIAKIEGLEDINPNLDTILANIVIEK